MSKKSTGSVTKKAANTIRGLRNQPLPQIRFGKDGIVFPAFELRHGLKIPLALINQTQH